MASNADAIVARVNTVGPDGKLLPATTGKESEAELKEMVLWFTEKCPRKQHHQHCPFRMLEGLSYTSLQDVVDGLSREAALGLFELEHICRNNQPKICQSPDANGTKSP